MPPDPFFIVAQALVTGTSFQKGLAFEKIRIVNKSLSDAQYASRHIEHRA